MSNDDRCTKPQVKLFFSIFEAHHDGRLFVATEKWDERCAYALMKKQIIVRLYNHVYADPAYWNDLGIEGRIFQLASAIAIVEPDAVFCGATAALLYGIGSAYSLLDKVQVLLPRSTRRDTYEFVEYRRWRAGEVWQLGPFTLTDPYQRLSTSPERPLFAMRWVMSTGWLVSTVSSAKNCGHTHKRTAADCTASRVRLRFLNTWMEDRITVENPKHGRQ